MPWQLSVLLLLLLLLLSHLQLAAVHAFCRPLFLVLHD